jgi:hypothetical protein
MRSNYERQIATATEIQRNILQGSAKICSPYFGKFCKAVRDFKTAEWLAEKTNCSVRTAAYQISGEHLPSPESIALMVNIMVGREQP